MLQALSVWPPSRRGHGGRMGESTDVGIRWAPACWRIAHVVYDENQARLWVHGREVILERSGHALLSHLVRHAGEVVHKDALLEAGWTGRIVAENTLAKAVGRLRRALDDEDGRLLRVAHGYGYRLSGPVERIEQDIALGQAPETPFTQGVEAPHVPASPARGPWGLRVMDGFVVLAAMAAIMLAVVTWPAGGSGRDAPLAGAASIAVLPFADLSERHDQQYLADGLAEELLDGLTRLGKLQVAARTSSFAYRDGRVGVRDIGRQLGVHYVLEGSVRSSRDRVRVTVQLVDSSNGFHVWSQTYDRPMRELFVLQDDIVNRIVEALRVELGPDELRAAAHHGTTNPEAFRQYLYGRSTYQDDETSGRRAVVAFRRAVTIDPHFFDAWLSLALALNFDAVYPDSQAEVQANKREALGIVQRLITLRPRQADLYLHRGDMVFWHWWDLEAAQRDFERAAMLGLAQDERLLIRLARLHAAKGHMPEALAFSAKALDRNPQTGAWAVRAYHLAGVGRIDDARAAAQRALQVNPLDEHAHYYLGLCELLRGRLREAQDHFDDSSSTFRLAGTAMVEHALGNREASERSLQWLASRYGHVAPYLVADVLAWRGDADRAFDWMRRGTEVRDGSLMYLAFDPLITPLRKDPRWPRLLRQVGLNRYLLPAESS